MRVLSFVAILSLVFSVSILPQTMMVAHAQVASASASPSPSPSASIAPVVAASPAKSGIASAGDAIGNVASQIPLTGMVITILIGLYDFIRRKWPTKDPASLLRDLQMLFRGIGALLSKLDAFIDSIIGQNSQK